MSSLILCNNNKPFLNQIMMCDEKWTLYNNQQQWLDREEAPKHVPKSNLHQKMPWSLFSGLLPIWSTTAFWIPVKTLYLRSMLKNQWDALQTTMPAAGICQQNEPTSPWQHPTTHCTTNASKVEQTGPWNFAFSAIFIWPLANWLPLLNKFLQRKCFHNQQEAEDAFQVFAESRSIDVCAMGINKLISCWLKYVDCNGCYFNKDVFVFCYNYLKFTIKTTITFVPT